MSQKNFNGLFGFLTVVVVCVVGVLSFGFWLYLSCPASADADQGNLFKGCEYKADFSNPKVIEACAGDPNN